MNNLKLILVGVFCLFAVLTLKAQDKPVDYFAGKWNVTVVGTPNGDAKMLVTLERVDGKLTGTLLNSGQGEPTKFSRVEEKENSVTLYFTSSGYDVYLQLEKKDENIVKGSMMDMFDASGTRVIE
jgi:hypothetical protein